MVAMFRKQRDIHDVKRIRGAIQRKPSHWNPAKTDDGMRGARMFCGIVPLLFLPLHLYEGLLLFRGPWQRSEFLFPSAPAESAQQFLIR